MISGSFRCQGRGEYRASGGGVGMPSMPILLLLQFDVYLICVSRLGALFAHKRMDKKRIEFHSVGICRGVVISEKVVGIEKRRRSTSFSVLCDCSMHVNVSSFMIWWTKDLDFARNCPMIHGYFVGLCYHLGHLLNSECPKLPGGLKASWYEHFGRVPQPQAGPVWAVIFMWCKLQLLAWTLWLRTGGILVILTEKNGKTQLLELSKSA